MKTVITIDEKTVEVDGKQYRMVEVEPKLPTWAEMSRGGRWGRNICTLKPTKSPTDAPANLKTERSARKLATFNKLLIVADYLNEGWEPEFNEERWELRFEHSCLAPENWRTILTTGVSFATRELVLRAIEIFRANGDEQELIEFYTK
jgi:hypothetical protein